MAGKKTMADETRFGSVLGEACKQGKAVGAFTCYNLEEFEAVVRAAESRLAPVIVLISPASFTSHGGERLVKAYASMVDDASVDILVQLDHVSDRHQIERAAACEIDAVMADGSKLPFEENVAFTANVACSLQGRGIGVEAELGRVEGQEDETGEEVLGGAMTDPEEAEEFRKQTGVDCLAVAIGNVHGNYSAIPSLDWERFEEIRGRDPQLLSLHGASGLPEKDLRKAVSFGISKINVNTELRAAYFGRIGTELGQTSESLNLKRLSDGVIEAVQEVVDAKLMTFGWTGAQ